MPKDTKMNIEDEELYAKHFKNLVEIDELAFAMWVGYSVGMAQRLLIENKDLLDAFTVGMCFSTKLAETDPEIGQRLTKITTYMTSEYLHLPIDQMVEDLVTRWKLRELEGGSESTILEETKPRIH